MDGRAVAKAVADRLQELVPATYLVEACDGLVQISRRDGTGGGAGAAVAEIVDQPGDPIENLVAACYSALDLAQDVVVKDSRELWPGSTPNAPRVLIEGPHLRLWYGTDTRVDLKLRPIDLD